MTRVLITGANSFIGTSVEAWLLNANYNVNYNDNVNYNVNDNAKYQVDTVDTMNDAWKQADFSQYDVVFHVAGIAHVDPKPEMAPLYYKVNRDLTVEIAKHAKECGVKQFIFMSSQIVYHASKSMKGTVIGSDTLPNPNDFYGDSKLQAEKGLAELMSPSFAVAMLRPCMIYGTNGKGNFQRLARLAQKTPVFPEWHNKRSMLYIDNLCEFVKQCIDRRMCGYFHLQNREFADTVEIVKFYAKQAGHKMWCTRLFNPLVWLGSFVLTPLCKMFSNQYYEQELTTYDDFDYQLVSFEESLKRVKV